jgi:hypothetical protein
METIMRTTYALAIAASLFAAPAIGQVIFQVPNNDASRHAAQAEQDRAAGREAHQRAEMDAARGDYEGAAEAQRDARHDWHAARHHDYRAQEESSGSTVIIGR